MLLEHRLEIDFERSHVPEPLLCEMARRFQNVMFNIDTMSVGIHEAMIRIALVGEEAEVRLAHEYLASFGTSLKTLSRKKYKGELPKVPERQADSADADSVGHERIVEKKIWLTVLGTLQHKPLLWELSRRFDITYKLMQSVTSDLVGIVSMLIWGPAVEVTGAVSFLRELGVNVEYGEVAVSAPFTPVG